MSAATESSDDHDDVGTPPVQSLPETTAMGLREKFIVVLLVVFLSLLGTFIYNETRTPLYQTHSLLKLETNGGEDTVLQLNFYQFQSRLQNYIEELTAPAVLDKLADDPALNYLAKTEREFSHISNKPENQTSPAPLLNKVDKNELKARIEKALSLEINPDNSHIEITVRDKNPKIAVTIANLLLTTYQNESSTPDAMIEDFLKAFRVDVARAVDEAILGKIPENKTQEKNNSPEHLKKLQRQKLELLRIIRELHYILDGTQVHLPLALSESKLSSMHSDMLSLEFELQNTLSDESKKDKLARLGFLKANFAIELRKAIKNLHRQLEVLSKELSEQSTQNQNPDVQDVLASNNDFETFQIMTANDTFIRNNEKLTVIERAHEPIHPRSPDKIFNLWVALGASSLLGSLLAIFLAKRNHRISNEDEIETMLHLRVLSVVPNHPETSKGAGL